jgi:hypothetical protein
MIKLNKDQQRQPIGGHHFNDNGFMIRGESFDEVVAKIKEYRLNNALPVGKPDMEVLQYYSDKYPFMVHNDDGTPPPKGPSKSYADWREWVWGLWRKPELRHVTGKEAAERWVECSMCPYNIPINTDGMEAKEIAKKAFLLRRGESVPKFIGFCACHRFDIGVASFLEAPGKRSGKKEDSETHPGCWV